MKSPQNPGYHRALAILAAVLAAPLLALADSTLTATSDVVAVYASVGPDYIRTPNPAGGFKTETFAFGDGGLLGGTMRDLSIDKVTLQEVGRLMAPALAKQNYVPASDPRKTDLLVMVYWGLTPSSQSQPEAPLSQGIGLSGIPPPRPTAPAGTGHANGSNGDPSMSGENLQAAISLSRNEANAAAADAGLSLEDFANVKRDQQDQQTALVLGYLPALKESPAANGTALEQRRQDLLDEVEEGRYFVVLMAYDFRTLLGQKKRKLLWEARFSIRQRGHDFSKDLAAMAANAGHYFGKDSGGLKRDRYNAEVDIGELKIVGNEDDKK